MGLGTVTSIWMCLGGMGEEGDTEVGGAIAQITPP
jgi:hypothetical protein